VTCHKRTWQKLRDGRFVADGQMDPARCGASYKQLVELKVIDKEFDSGNAYTDELVRAH
jgi:hypothetical protein